MTRSLPAESEKNPLPEPVGGIDPRSMHLRQVGIKLTMHVTAEEISKVADSSESLWHAYCDARLRQFEKRG